MSIVTNMTITKRVKRYLTRGILVSVIIGIKIITDFDFTKYKMMI